MSGEAHSHASQFVSQLKQFQINCRPISIVTTVDTTSEQGRMRKCPATALLEASWEISPPSHYQALEQLKLKT